MTVYSKHVNRKQTSQSEPIPGKSMVPNAAGGFAFKIDDWDRLRRFLILGTEGGTYYAGEKEITIQNAECVTRCIKEDGKKTVDMVVEISEAGRAPKNDPAVFVLALCAGADEVETRKYALEALPKVCRIGTHLFQFGESIQALRGWGRSLRKAVAKWYTDRDPDKLAYQMAKYQQRNGWTHHDMLHLCHAKPLNDKQNTLFKWAKQSRQADDKKDKVELSLPPILEAMEAVKSGDSAVVIKAIKEHGLTREMVPTEMLTNPNVWEALLEDMPMMAMIRNLGNMSKCGLLAPMSEASKIVCERLINEEFIQKARIHPINVLVAMRTYAQGHGMKGTGTWTVTPKVVDALDDAFYKSFKFVEPTGKRFVIGVDVSGSMTSNIAGFPISSCEVASAFALSIAKTEENYWIAGFDNGFKDLAITPRMRMDDVMTKTRNINGGGTDCSLPMMYSLQKKIKADVFVVITDNETWAGNIHPTQALQKYRNEMGIPAKLIVLGTTATECSIADKNDPGMLDIAGFDSAVPQIIADFAR